MPATSPSERRCIDQPPHRPSMRRALSHVRIGATRTLGLLLVARFVTLKGATEPCSVVGLHYEKHSNALNRFAAFPGLVPTSNAEWVTEWFTLAPTPAAGA